MASSVRLPRAGKRAATRVRAPIPAGTWHRLAEDIILRGAHPEVARVVHAVVAEWRARP